MQDSPPTADCPVWHLNFYKNSLFLDRNGEFFLFEKRKNIKKIVIFYSGKLEKGKIIRIIDRGK